MNSHFNFISLRSKKPQILSCIIKKTRKSVNVVINLRTVLKTSLRYYTICLATHVLSIHYNS